jgi:hypothetical protein
VGDAELAGLRWADRWPTGPRVVEFHWTAMRPTHRGENQCQAGPVRKFQLTVDRKNEKGFLFFKSYLNSNPI